MKPAVLSGLALALLSALVVTAYRFGSDDGAREQEALDNTRWPGAPEPFATSDAQREYEEWADNLRASTGWDFK